MYNITNNTILIENEKIAGINKNGIHPPQKRITFKELIHNIFEYSPKENKANPIAEYSTL
jgi:hypothetical protein